VSPQNGIDYERQSESNSLRHQPMGSSEAWNTDPIVEKKSVRRFLSSPLYWLSYVVAAFLVILVWSAVHLEGTSEIELD